MKAVQTCALVLISLLLLAACGKTGDRLSAADPLPGQQPELQIQLDPSNGLPSLPYSSLGTPRSESATEAGELTWLGKEVSYAMQQNATVAGDTLVLSAQSGNDLDRLAYALYSSVVTETSLGGQRAVSLTVKTARTDAAQEYYLAVSNYTTGVWEWFGPVSTDSFTVDLSTSRNQYIHQSGLDWGSCWFMLVCYDSNIVTHLRSTLVHEELAGQCLPEAPLLNCDQGLDTGIIHVYAWSELQPGDTYEFWRKSAEGTDAWELVAESPENALGDYQVVPQITYLYRARVNSSRGYSGWSRVCAGSTSEPIVTDYSVDVAIQLEGTDAPSDLTVKILGLGDYPIYASGSTTDGVFNYHATGLPPGEFIIVPYQPQTRFEPPFQAVTLSWNNPIASVSINASSQDLPNDRFQGFIYSYNGDSRTGFLPIKLATVELYDASTLDFVAADSTDLNGYFALDNLPVGQYRVNLPQIDAANETGICYLNHLQVLEPRYYEEGSGAALAPDAPESVTASDGEYLDRVELSWGGGANAAKFIIGRSTVGVAGSYLSLGETAGFTFTDYTALTGLMYQYQVTSYLNGRLSPSAQDQGSVKLGPCTLAGTFSTTPGHYPPAPPTVKVIGLAPTNARQPVFESLNYRAEGVWHGKYLVVPHAVQSACDPPYYVVDLTSATEALDLDFTLSQPAELGPLNGFAYSITPGNAPGLVLLPGVQIQVRDSNSSGFWTFNTNADGYFESAGLLGYAETYTLTAVRSAMAFNPSSIEIPLVAYTPPLPAEFVGTAMP